MKKEIEYIEPLNIAWNKMTKMLFKPFDIKKWIVLGFIAWVALLGEGGCSANFDLPINENSSTTYHNNSQDNEIEVQKNTIVSQNGEPKVHNNDNSFGITTIKKVKKNTNHSQNNNLKDNGPFKAISKEFYKLIDSTDQSIIIVCILIFVISLFFVLTIVITILWLKSRFSFIFLDNILKDDTQISEPWKRFITIGNSSFWWQISIGILSRILVLVTITIPVIICLPWIETGNITTSGIASIIIGGLLLIIEIIILNFMHYLYSNFVTIIMYKKSIKAIAAWKEFLPLFKKNIIPFILYSLITFTCGIALVACIVAFGLATCCIGFILLMLPYVGAVVLLPAYLFFRLYSIEFFAQFGDDYNVIIPDSIEDNKKLK